MKRGWEQPPFYVFALTAAMIGASAGFLAYAVCGIEILRESRLNSVLVQARLTRLHSEDGRPILRGGLFVTKENMEDVLRFLRNEDAGARVRSAELEMRSAEPIEAAEAYIVPFRVDLSGDFPAVTAYLNALDRAPWMLVPAEVRIVRDTGAGGTKAEIDGFAYWR